MQRENINGHTKKRGILWLSSNMCETDKKGLTELSEINLVRPFFVGFYFAFFG